MHCNWVYASVLPGHLANILQEANVPIISDVVCNAPDYYDSQITTSMFCAGYEKGGTDACQVSVGSVAAGRSLWNVLLVLVNELLCTLTKIITTSQPEGLPSVQPLFLHIFTSPFFTVGKFFYYCCRIVFWLNGHCYEQNFPLNL